MNVYQTKLLKESFAKWLGSMEWDYFVTLNLNAASTVTGVRNRFKGFCQHLDRRILGCRYQNYPNKRTEIVAFPEHIHSNCHLHCLVRIHGDAMPKILMDDFFHFSWSEVVNRGSADVQYITDPATLAAYVTKECWKIENYSSFMFSKEFVT